MQQYKQICLLSLLLLVPLVLHAQIQIDWSRVYSESPLAKGIAPAHSSGYVVAGYVGSHSLMGIDTTGAILWHHDYEIALSRVLQAVDSGYIALGESDDTTQWASLVVHLIRTDNAGNTVWHRTYADSSQNIAGALCTTADGGYLLATTSYENLWLLRLDQVGDTLWTRTYNFGREDFVWGNHALHQTTDGGFIMAGVTQDSSSLDYEALLLKTDAVGQMEWMHTYGEPNRSDGARIVLELPRNGYLVSGMRRLEISGSPLETAVVRTDLLGNVIWEHTYGGDSPTNIIPAPDSAGWIVGISSRSNGPSTDAAVVRIDSAGAVAWEAMVGTDSMDEAAGDLIPAESGGFLLAGHRDFHPQTALWLTQFTVDSTTKIRTDSGRMLPDSPRLFTNYPNPFNPTTTIGYELPAGTWRVHLSVYDVAGRLVRTLVHSAKSGGAYQVQWNGQDHAGSPVASGAYLARLTLESPAGKVLSRRTQKMIVLR